MILKFLKTKITNYNSKNIYHLKILKKIEGGKFLETHKIMVKVTARLGPKKSHLE